MKNRFLDNIVWIILLFIGSLYLIISCILYTTGTIPFQNREKAAAIITSIEEMDEDDYKILVSYVIDGNIYNSKLNTYSSSYYEGKEITIYYDKTNPVSIADTDIDIIAIIFGGVGIYAIAIAIIIIIFKLRKKQLIIKLKETGYITNAKYLRTSINALFTVNGKHPYKIICEMDNSIDGKTHEICSKNIWYNPEKIIKERNIKSFRVYYNPNNLKQYYMDVDMYLENK